MPEAAACEGRVVGRQGGSAVPVLLLVSGQEVLARGGVVGQVLGRPRVRESAHLPALQQSR